MTPDLRPALDALDALIAEEMQRLRARYALSLDEFRGLYVSDAMAEALLARAGVPQAAVRGIPAALAAPLAGAGRSLGLCPLGTAMLFLALAPELDARYPALFAWLNDDVARRWPTQDLARRLFLAPDDAHGLRRLAAILSPQLPRTAGGLVAPGLLLAAGDEATAPQHLRGWRPAAALVHHLLRLPGFSVPELAWLSYPGEVRPAAAPAEGVALLVSGAAGSGRRRAADAWAARLGRHALILEATPAGPPDAATIQAAQLAAILNDALLVIVADEPGPLSGLDPAEPLAVIAPATAGWERALAPRLVLHRTVPLPNAPDRARAWRTALAARGFAAAPRALEAVAGRFELTPGAIVRAGRRLASEHAPGRLAAADLLAAGRAESAADMGPLARLVRSPAAWTDLVLPGGALAQLRDFAAAIAARDQVFAGWGFAAVGRGAGTGLAALFSGGSGTGKTMSASVVAGEIGLDLWRIDLAATVSKYIGETEKNLERLFSAAGASNAILFFDEADALFGKRSEVKDSHDRYANIEIAYLLQRLEDHPGVVILASNLSRNLDSAFLRRLPFVIEFPMPDATARARLWRKAIPAAAPLDPGVDLAELGRRFELSGGDIRTAALEAAFLAVARDARIDRAALETAIRRQLLKRGQLPGAVAASGAKGAANGRGASAGDGPPRGPSQ